jgi:hypothetical protein
MSWNQATLILAGGAETPITHSGDFARQPNAL